MSKITLETIKEIEVEYAKWAEFLNIGVGLLSFNLGISCLGTTHAGISSLLSLIFTFMFMLYGKNHFPQKIRYLRKTELIGIDELTLLGIESKYFGFRSVLRNFPIFLTGWLFLGGVGLYSIY